MSRCTVIECDDSNPEPLVRRYGQQLLAEGGQGLLLAIHYPCVQYWLEGKPKIRLTGFYCLERQAGLVNIELAVAEGVVDVAALCDEAECSGRQCFEVVCRQVGLPTFHAAQPLPLVSLSVAKPWGREIWYTGIEQRGVAGVGTAECQSPLPYVLSALPDSLCSQQQSLILLKVLDPLPDEVFGDLYFELHQEKREVYVVTHVDEQAWPGGVGGIRFGFNQRKRQQFGSDEAFKAAFAAAVKSYESVRRDIDRQLDQLRAAEGYQINEPVAAAVLATWLATIPEHQQQRERELRATMEAFTDRLELKVGDVVKVPCYTPHSLQHGVRTVEFQTPVYERLIVSFAQKVLTQGHWDTDQAVELMSLDDEPAAASEVLVSTAELAVERIVDFEDFEVRRVRLESGATMVLSAPDSYGLLMAIDKELVLSSITLAPEQALLLPGSWPGGELVNYSAGVVSFLLAYPK